MPDNPTLAETLAAEARESPRYALPAESAKRKAGYLRFDWTRVLAWMERQSRAAA